MSETKRCPRCGETKPLSEYLKNAGQPQGVQTYCRPCHYEYRYGKGYAQSWYQRNKERERARARTYAKDNREARKAYRVAYNAAHPEHIRALRRKREQAWKIAAFNAYGGPICACCGEVVLAFLSLDHIDQIPTKEKKKDGAGSAFYSYLKTRGYPQELNLRVLCFNCNLGRRVNGGTCPHQEKPSA